MNENVLNIAVIDDNFAVRQGLKVFIYRVLQKLTLESQIYTASDGVEGIGYVLVTVPQIIVVDTSLPKYSGRQLLDYIKTNQKFSKSGIKIIVISDGQDVMEDGVKNMNYLDKNSPFFLKVLEKYLYLALGGYAPEEGHWFADSFIGGMIGGIIHSANNVELSKSSVAKTYFLPFKLVGWIFMNLKDMILNILVGMFFMFVSPPSDVNSSQMKIDNNIFRWRVYPLTLVSLATGIAVLVGITAYLVLLST